MLDAYEGRISLGVYNEDASSWASKENANFDLQYIFLKKNKFIYFIYLFLAALGLCCCVRGATLRCGEWASHCSGFFCCGARAR